jgi:peptidylprolyl isomerase
MAQANTGDTVKVHYTGTLEDGSVFDSSEGGDPLEFTIGEDEIIPGFEEGIIGMKVGQSKTIVVPSDQAYGPHLDEMVMEVARDKVPAGHDPEVGQFLQIVQEDGHHIPVQITEVTDEHVILDANHPLAGRDLSFDVTLVEIATGGGK